MMVVCTSVDRWMYLPRSMMRIPTRRDECRKGIAGVKVKVGLSIGFTILTVTTGATTHEVKINGGLL